MSSCGDDRLAYRKLRSLTQAGFFLPTPTKKKKKMRARTLITLFQGREVLPCVSLYMLELCSYKHTHVRKECSLLLSFGPGLVTATEKSSKKPLRGF